MMTKTNVNLIGLYLLLQFGFPTLELLIENLPRSKIMKLGLCGNDLDLTMTSRHVYHLILLIHQASYLEEVDLSGNSKLAKCVPLLLKAASNMKVLHFTNMLGNQQLLEMGPILQSNTTLKVWIYRYIVAHTTVSNHFASLSRQSQHLNQSHNYSVLLLTMMLTEN